MRIEWGRLLCALVLVLAFGQATATDNPTDTLTCPDSGFTDGGAVDDVCWDCIFPITINGQVSGEGSFSDIPDDHASGTCTCIGRTGQWSQGATYGMWQPAHLFELVRQPWCSPVMGDVLDSEDGPWQDPGGGDGGDDTSVLSNLPRWGGHADADDEDGRSSDAFYHFHWWVFPANMIINGIVGSWCTVPKQTDNDIAYVSEIDSTWHDNKLSIYTTPEARLFANTTAIYSCIADGVAASFYKPIIPMFWCAGTWGLVYPFSGFVSGGDDPPRMTSLLTFRALGMLHRRGLAKRVYGEGAVCFPNPAPIITKQQYKLQAFYPMPQTNDYHWLGKSPFMWNEWRNIPYKGEDYVYVEWRWTECCITYN